MYHIGMKLKCKEGNEIIEIDAINETSIHAIYKNKPFGWIRKATVELRYEVIQMTLKEKPLSLDDDGKYRFQIETDDKKLYMQFLSHMINMYIEQNELLLASDAMAELRRVMKWE